MMVIFRLVRTVAIFSLLAIIGGLGSPIAVGAQTPTAGLEDLPSDAIEATVVSVQSGDEFVAVINDDSYKFGFLGLRAPDPPSDSELGDCFGFDAASRLEQILKEGTVIFVSGEETISVDDLSSKVNPVYVWLENPKKLGTAYLLNAKILRDGNAGTYQLSKAKSQKDKLEAAEDKAKDGNKGLWKNCSGPTVKIQPTPTPPPSDDELKQEYTWLQDPREILTRPYQHLGEKYAFCGNILSIQIARPGYVYTPGDTTSTQYESIMQVWATLPDGSREAIAVGFNGDTTGMYEDSFVCVWGTLVDTMSGTNAFGGSISNPLLDARFVELQ